MAHITLFVQNGMPAKAVITGSLADQQENADLQDAVAAFLTPGGDALIMADSASHTIEVFRA